MDSAHGDCEVTFPLMVPVGVWRFQLESCKSSLAGDVPKVTLRQLRIAKVCDVLDLSPWGTFPPMTDSDQRPAEDGAADERFAVGVSVRVYPGTDRERLGVVLEDFGDSAGQRVDIGEHHIVDAARRWAVRLGDGNLVFVDSDDLTPG
jgi:hypothetical protein